MEDVSAPQFRHFVAFLDGAETDGALSLPSRRLLGVRKGRELLPPRSGVDSGVERRARERESRDSRDIKKRERERESEEGREQNVAAE